MKKTYPEIKIVIANNHISFVKNFIKSSFNTELLDDIIISAEIGKIKPNIDFYQHILDKFKIDKAELLFLDDNTENIKGAALLGINTIKVEKNGFCRINKKIIK